MAALERLVLEIGLTRRDRRHAACWGPSSVEITLHVRYATRKQRNIFKSPTSCELELCQCETIYRSRSRALQLIQPGNYKSTGLHLTSLFKIPKLIHVHAYCMQVVDLRKFWLPYIHEIKVPGSHRKLQKAPRGCRHVPMAHAKLQ